MNSINITNYGTVVVLLAAIGAASIVTHLVMGVDRLITTMRPRVKQFLIRRRAAKNLRKAILNRPRMSEAERTAMQQGADEALAAYEFAQQSVRMMRGMKATPA